MSSRRATVSPITHMMTVDVEDYFQVSAFDDVVPRAAWDDMESRVCRNTERLLEIFDRAGVRATFFVLGWVADRFPALVRDIAAHGHELASHSYWHRLVYDLTPDEFREDLKKAKDAIETAAGPRVVGFRAPSYSITSKSLWALDVLIEEGYEYDSSIFPVHHDRYGIPSARRHPHRMTTRYGSLLEIPGSTIRLGETNLPIAGGGYFRLLPYAWTRWGITRLGAVEHTPAVFYIHPWEIDPEQPRLPVSTLTRIRHYGWLDRAAEKLDRLLSEFRFDTVTSVLRTTSSQVASPAKARALAI